MKQQANSIASQLSKSRWSHLMRGLNLPESGDCFTELCQAYGEPHRYYHTGAHIKALLNHLDRVTGQFRYPQEAELAIWFHDAIYDPQSHRNEANSADWAHRFLTSVNYCTNGIERVQRLIMATAHHGHPQTPDELLLVDIDLTIFGADKHVFDTYETNIRQEYSHVSLPTYRKKRRKLLAAFLEADTIYRTGSFKALFEQQARANLARAIQQLT